MKRNFDNNTTKTPVSIIIAAKNELENLKELIPVLLEQNYPDFEIIVVNNNSTDNSEVLLKEMADENSKIVVLNLGNTPTNISPKKFSISKAISIANNDLLLFTDADCRPDSSNWINEMVKHKKGDLVLAYSPYFEPEGILNGLIQYETLQTGMQYLGLAKIGFPAFAVGRNLLYDKSVFVKNNGFANHLDFWSGDDDLFVNEVANKENTSIAISFESFVFSKPKNTWKSWAKQKIRHLSVGNKYKFESRFLIGINWLSQIGTFALGLFFLPYYIGFLAIKSILLLPVKSRLKNPLNLFQLMFYDFLFSIYLIVFGLITLFLPKKKQEW